MVAFSFSAINMTNNANFAVAVVASLLIIAFCPSRCEAFLPVNNASPLFQPHKCTVPVQDVKQGLRASTALKMGLDMVTYLRTEWVVRRSNQCAQLQLFGLCLGFVWNCIVEEKFDGLVDVKVVILLRHCLGGHLRKHVYKKY